MRLAQTSVALYNVNSRAPGQSRVFSQVLNKVTTLASLCNTHPENRDESQASAVYEVAVYVQVAPHEMVHLPAPSQEEGVSLRVARPHKSSPTDPPYSLFVMQDSSRQSREFLCQTRVFPVTNSAHSSRLHHVHDVRDPH
jgi:hypothetical protein